MARRADAALAALTTPEQQAIAREQQAIARRIFLRLVQFGEGRADTRRQQTVAELRGGGDDPILFEQTLHHLTADRLLTLSGDEQTTNPSVDLAHEALISGWPRLQQWLGERREAEQTRRRLEAKAAEWVRLGRGSDGLLHGYALAEARQWLVGPDAEDLGYTANLADLVRASRKYQMKMRAILWGFLASIALIIGYIIYDIRIRENQGFTAKGLVTALKTADIHEVPRLIKQLQPDLDLVRDRLRKLAGPPDPSQPDPSRVTLRERLHAALALLSVDQTQVDYLFERLLRADTRPSQLLVIRQALHDHGHAPALTPKLRALLEETPTGLTDSQLRAAGALALFEPKDPRWPALGPRVAAKLVQQNPLLVGDWREAFQTVAPALTPLLRQLFADRNQPEQRASAFMLLFEFATDLRVDDPRRTEDLAELIGEANPEQFEQVLKMLQADHDRAIDLLAGKLAKPARFDDALARCQGQIATALVRLGRADRVWPLLKHADDPGVRTELIHDLAKFGVEPARGDRAAGRSSRRSRPAARWCWRWAGIPPTRVPAGERQAQTSSAVSVVS